MRGVLTGVAQDGNGAIIAGATVTIFDADTTDTSTVYDAKTGGSVISGAAVTADDNGFWVAYVDFVNYAFNVLFDIVYSKSGYGSITYPDIGQQGMGILAWADHQVPLTSTKQGATNKPDFDNTNVGYLFPQNDAAEILRFITELPHDWKVETTLMPHIHWQQMNSNLVVWKMDYKVIPLGGAVPANFTTVASTTSEFTYSSGNLHQETDVGTGIDMTGITSISAVIVGKLYRDDNVDAGAGSGDALAWSMDLHYLRDGFGARTELTK